MSKITIRNLIISILFFLISGAVFGFVVYHVNGQGNQLHDQIDILMEERTREESYYQLEKIAGETTKDREQLESFFLIREGDSIDFLNRLEVLAVDIGVVLEIENLERITEEETGHEWIRVSLSFSGSRELVQRFIKVLENLPYVIRVTQIDMTKRSSTEWETELVMQVRILAYD